MQTAPPALMASRESQSDVSSASAASVPLPPASSSRKQGRAQYALSDEQYKEWRAALTACKAQPGSVEALKSLEGKRELLNWRNPATGQTLLTALATSNATGEVLQAAVEMGCDVAQRNAYGETAGMVQSRKGGGQALGSFGDFMSSPARGSANARRSRAMPMAQLSAPPLQQPQLQLQQQQPPPPQPQPQPRSSWTDRLGRRGWGLGAGYARNAVQQPRSAQDPMPFPQPAMSGPSAALQPMPAVEQLAASPSVAAASGSCPGPSASAKRKSGWQLASSEVASVPQAQMCLDLDWNAEATLDREALTSAMQATYGPRAKIQIDEVADKSSAQSRSMRGCSGRVQNVKARVMFDDVREAQQQQMRSCTTRSVQEDLARNMQLSSDAVAFEEQSKMDEVDKITLKLDSDSSSILCGACLLYNATGECEKVVCHSDRFFANAVAHSGDSQVDGKSVHTITLAMSRLPSEVSELYFTLCSCGPSDLSGFKNPNIMLYDTNMPDANLLEYTIGQAGKSPSCVMAKMLRQPSWSAGDKAVIARILRKLRMPLLAIDICLTMAEQSTWAIQALGTEEWHCAKVCSNYHIAKDTIEARLKAEKAKAEAAKADGKKAVESL